MIKLHLGCFDRIAPGWQNTDVTPHLWIARVPVLAGLLHRAGLISPERYEQHRSGIFRGVCYLNARKRFPYKDNSVSAVFSSHFLEHLFIDEAAFCLSEIHRVLRPRGVCRIVVPDLDGIVRGYDSASPDVFLRRIFEESERKSMKNLHHWHYNATSLIALLRRTGFSEAYQCGYRQGRCPDLELLDNRPDESLYVEAVK